MFNGFTAAAINANRKIAEAVRRNRKLHGAMWLDYPRTPNRTPPHGSKFLCAEDEIAEHGYDLSLNRYKEVVHEEVEHVPPQQILVTLAELETKIQQRMKELEEMLER